MLDSEGRSVIIDLQTKEKQLHTKENVIKKCIEPGKRENRVSEEAGESKRAREQESKRAREQESKRAREQESKRVREAREVKKEEKI